MDEPVIAYMMNRAPQLVFAMVSAAAITMPRQEGALRGTVEETFTGSTTRGPVEVTNDVTSAAMKAAAEIVQDGNLSDMMIQRVAVQIGSAAAVAMLGQLAHAACPKRWQVHCCDWHNANSAR